MTPDLIIHNARLFSGDGSLPPAATALAVKARRIAALGGENDILPLAGARTRVIDAGGRWVLPAFMDSHTHFCEYAARKLQVELSGCDSMEAALDLIRRHTEQTPPGAWVTGGGWDRNRWNLETQPDRRLLDEISTQHLIAMKSKDWHSLWVNTPVLTLCGMEHLHADPPGGRIHRYSESGEPCGVLQETACRPVYAQMTPPTLARITPALQETFKEFHRFGITSVHSVETPYDFAYCQQLYNCDQLGLRVFWYFPVQYLAESEGKGWSAGKGNSFLKICGVKMFSDGALGSQTADMLAPYEGLDSRGVTVMTPEELVQRVRQCVAQQLPAAIHAIGDRANRHVLDALGKAGRLKGTPMLRHRIEHAQLLHPDDIARFRDYGVIASMQPIHLAEDVPLIERYWGKRGRYAYAWNSLQTAGARVIFGSDTPISSFDPWKGLYSAVARKPQCDPSRDVFHAEERISLAAAITAYTANSAWAVGEEHHLGTIATGKLADLIMIDQDIFNGPPELLLETSVMMTLQNGRVVYQQ